MHVVFIFVVGNLNVPSIGFPFHRLVNSVCIPRYSSLQRLTYTKSDACERWDMENATQCTPRTFECVRLCWSGQAYTHEMMLTIGTHRPKKKQRVYNRKKEILIAYAWQTHRILNHTRASLIQPWVEIPLNIYLNLMWSTINYPK